MCVGVCNAHDEADRATRDLLVTTSATFASRLVGDEDLVDVRRVGARDGRDNGEVAGSAEEVGKTSK